MDIQIRDEKKLRPRKPVEFLCFALSALSFFVAMLAVWLGRNDNNSGHVFLNVLEFCPECLMLPDLDLPYREILVVSNLSTLVFITLAFILYQTEHPEQEPDPGKKNFGLVFLAVAFFGLRFIMLTAFSSESAFMKEGSLLPEGSNPLAAFVFPAINIVMATNIFIFVRRKMEEARAD